MRAGGGGSRRPLQVVRTASRGVAARASEHWRLGLFSLAAAFIMWVVVEDVENPRAEGLVPVDAGQGIPIEALNVPDGFIVPELSLVRVNVDAREADLLALRGADFKATVDLSGITSEGPANLPVRVEARRSGVRVLSVQPPIIEVRLARAAVRELPVTVRLTGPGLPEGYNVSGSPVIEPNFVTVRGRQDLVDSVDSLEVDVNLSGVRDEVATVDGDVVPRTASGNTVNVTLSQSRARITFTIEQTFSQRTLVLVPSIVGTPAPGFIVASITIEPNAVVVTGPKSIVERLEPLAIDPLDVTGARGGQLTRTQQIQRPQNVLLERQTVVVRVDIKAIECGSQASAPCGGQTFPVAPDVVSLPPGLAMKSPVQVFVKVSGPLAALAALKPTDIKATLSLAGARAGVNQILPAAVLPAGSPLKIDAVEPVTIELFETVTP